MAGKIEFNSKAITFIILMAISVLAWHYFFVQLNLSVNDFTDLLGYGNLIAKASSLNFILFLVLFPTTLAIGIAGAKIFDPRTAKLFGILGVVLGELISVGLYPQLLNLAIVGLFYIVGIFLCIETASVKKEEVKQFADFRISNSALGSAFMIMGLGIVIFGAMATYSMNPQLVQDFEKKLLKGDLVQGINLADVSADVVIQTQQQDYHQLVNLPQYQKLESKQDPDVQEFVFAVNTAAGLLSSPEYKKQVMDELNKQQKSPESKNTFQTLKEGIPVIQQLEDYYWVLITMIIYGVFTLLSSIIWKPLGIVYGMIALKIAEKALQK